jgi:hypothetical protein
MEEKLFRNALGKSVRKKFDEGCLTSHPAIIHIGEDSKKARKS